MNTDLGSHCLQYQLPMWADPEGVGRPDPPPLLKNHKNIGFPKSNICPDPLNNHKATKPAFNVGPTSARQRNAI